LQVERRTYIGSVMEHKSTLPSGSLFGEVCNATREDVSQKVHARMGTTVASIDFKNDDDVFDDEAEEA
jgi:hypothetical protein